MFTAFLTVFAALSILGLIVLIVAARRAPVGFEDAAGFHASHERLPAEAILGATLSAG